MNHFDLKDGVLHCEDVSLEAIAAAVGTPAYVYSSATLARHVRVFRAAFAPRPVHIAFAVKANGNLAVLATLAREGCGADTVSEGEIRRARAAGIPADRIIFSGVGKTEAELRYAVSAGVGQINVESPAELALLEEVSADARGPVKVAVRVNPDIGAGGHAKIRTGGRETKFGVGADEALALYRRIARAPRLEPAGLAVHIGSQIRDFAPLEAAFALLKDMTRTLRAEGFPVARLDLGGGLAVPYFNEPEPPGPADYAALVERALGDLEVDYAFEPGRMIAANAGVLLTRVIRLQERPGRRILVVDAGMNDLLRPAMYDAFHDLRPVRAQTAAAETFDIVGPICETGDTFARDRPLPPLAAGDLAAFMSAGAYGAVMASTYNARALVPEVLVAGDRFAVVRRRVEPEETMGWDQIPDWAAP